MTSSWDLHQNQIKLMPWATLMFKQDSLSTSCIFCGIWQKHWLRAYYPFFIKKIFLDFELCYIWELTCPNSHGRVLTSVAIALNGNTASLFNQVILLMTISIYMYIHMLFDFFYVEIYQGHGIPQKRINSSFNQNWRTWSASWRSIKFFSIIDFFQCIVWSAFKIQ